MLTNAWPGRYGRVILEQTDSTLDEAARRYQSLTQDTWILAHQQTGARGRRGRAWQMPAGNFAATLVLRDTSKTAQPAQYSFVAALALFDAFVAITGRTDCFALKWPNDVLLNGGKAAGILLEGIPQHGIAVGIGVNLAAAPDAGLLEPRALHPVSIAGEFGITLPPEDFLNQLAPAFDRHAAQLTQYGFAPIRQAWLARASKLGQTITARLPNEDITGTFETLDENGYLILQTTHERRKIAAADIFFE